MKPLRSLLEVPAPAKLNLFLHIIGRRADGYHLLQSVFQLIDWCDMLHFERRDDGVLARHDRGAVLPPDDLCLRAARSLQAASGIRLGVDIHLDKRVPWGAGLGGGSSDAASTLLALNRLWGLHWPKRRLLELALPLGADVPFFVAGQNAFVEGIGERLTPVDLPAQAYAVVKPPANAPTPAVFAHPELVRQTEPVILTGFLASMHSHAPGVSAPQGCAASFGRNDLQPVTQVLYPEVAQAAEWVQARFGNSRMSGSGSAVFASLGMHDSPLATRSMEALPSQWVGRLCRGLSGHPLAAWAD